MTAFVWLVVIVLGGYVALIALMYVFQRRLMYFPDRRRIAPATAGLPQVEEVELGSDDGERLIAWHIAPREGRSVILYFQGNAGGLDLRATRFAWLTEDGTGLVALCYRGFGGSSGKPSEAGLIRDAHAAYDFAAARYGEGGIVLFGESLGTAVAIALAAERKVAGLILDAPFTSAADVGAAAYPFVPVRPLIRDPFHSHPRVGRIAAPILVLHGERDTIVPIHLGERLFALANEPKQMVRFPQGGHVDLDGHGAIDAVKDFLAKLDERRRVP
jgi:fermentation-respiration switch protein FrsA (DUF1100 family)